MLFQRRPYIYIYKAQLSRVNFVVKTPSGLDHADDLSNFQKICSNELNLDHLPTSEDD